MPCHDMIENNAWAWTRSNVLSGISRVGQVSSSEEEDHKYKYWNYSSY